MITFLELGFAGPMPGVLDAPARSYLIQQGLSRGPETRNLVTGLVVYATEWDAAFQASRLGLLH